MNRIQQFLTIWMLLFFSSGFAQVNYKRAVVNNRIKIEGNIDVTWTFLSNLANLEKLVPSTIEKSTPVGNGKGSIVNLELTNNKGTIVEKVLRLDNEKRVICYSMISTPLPIKNYLACLSIVKIDEKTFEVQFQASFKVQEKNRKARIDAFNSLQLELLNNLKKVANEL